jgi:hypothetical protein
MTAPVIPIRPSVEDCLSEIRLYQDLISKVKADMRQDEIILADSKANYLALQNSLRVAIHRLHEALGV